jgi:hypothetical protein
MRASYRLRLLAALFGMTAAACGCKGRSTPGTVGPGGGDGGGGPAAAAACDKVRDHAALLYRDEATRLAKPDTAPAVIDEEVSDNVAMIVGDCRREPGRAACIAGAQSVAQLERDCAIAVDDEGTEGDQFKAR